MKPCNRDVAMGNERESKKPLALTRGRCRKNRKGTVMVSKKALSLGFLEASADLPCRACGKTEECLRAPDDKTVLCLVEKEILTRGRIRRTFSEKRFWHKRGEKPIYSQGRIVTVTDHEPTEKQFRK